MLLLSGTNHSNITEGVGKSCERMYKILFAQIRPEPFAKVNTVIRTS
jgi:hypothetical protein